MALLTAATIAAMQSIAPTPPLADGDIINVASYATSGDGGGGFFRWSASATDAVNPGTIFQKTGGGRSFSKDL